MSGHFALKGDIDIKSGEVFYFQRSFYIREGSLHFNESEINFDPHITVRAEARDMTNNEPVTISMVINDQSLENFTPSLESNPPLSQSEILSLLGERMLGSDPGEESNIAPFINSTVDVFAQFYVVRQFEKTVRNLAHLDMFSFRTQALQNAVLLNLPSSRTTKSSRSSYNSVSENLDTNSSSQARVGNYFDNTTVYIGKYIGPVIFTQLMVSLRYDEEQTTLGGMRIEPDFSIDLQTPIFNIRWDLIPEHLETFFVADNHITLTKKWTFP
jgi:hypothetical protein